MVNFFPIFSCILVAWAVVVSGRRHIHHSNAPIQSPAEAPSSIGAPNVDCMSLIYDMADCVAYLSIGGGEDKPDKSCCSGFKTVLYTDSDCICVALKSSANLGIEVNMTSAKALPSACGINAPPLNCNSEYYLLEKAKVTVEEACIAYRPLCVSTSPDTSPGTSPANPPPVNAPTPTSPSAPTPTSPLSPSAPTPATKTPAPVAHSVPVGAPNPVAYSVPVGAPSPVAASSGGYNTCAATLLTLVTMVISVSFCNVLV